MLPPRTLTLGSRVTLLALAMMGAATAQNAGNTRMIEQAAESANDTGGKQAGSAQVARLLTDALDDMRAQKFAAAIAKLESAQGIQGKTANDQHLINDMLSFSYLKTNNYEAAARAMEAEVRDGMSSRAEIAHQVRELSEIYFHLNHYDKAIDFGTRAIKGGFADERITTIVGQSYYLKGDYAGTRKFEEGLVEAQIKAGAIPRFDSLMLIYNACQKTNDDACAQSALKRIVGYYPKPES
jgi:tetratricopeptide (TPR) repeat protein